MILIDACELKDRPTYILNQYLDNPREGVGGVEYLWDMEEDLEDLFELYYDELRDRIRRKVKNARITNKS